MTDSLEAAAELYERAAAELDRASRHCRTAARHFRELPPGSAHAWAAFGHVLTAEDALRSQAQAHASKSIP
jgi:heme oxygenase